MGGFLAGLAVFSLCAGIVLAMNTATADGSRALYGISQDGMTIRWLGKLNRKHVPGQRDDAGRGAEPRPAVHVCV